MRTEATTHEHIGGRDSAGKGDKDPAVQAVAADRATIHVIAPVALMTPAMLPALRSVTAKDAPAGSRGRPCPRNPSREGRCAHRVGARVRHVRGDERGVMPARVACEVTSVVDDQLQSTGSAALASNIRAVIIWQARTRSAAVTPTEETHRDLNDAVREVNARIRGDPRGESAEPISSRAGAVSPSAVSTLALSIAPQSTRRSLPQVPASTAVGASRVGSASVTG